MAGTIFGFPWEGDLVTVPGEWEVLIFGYRIAHPFLAMLVLGVGIGHWGFNWAESYLTKNSQFNKFEQEFNDIRPVTAEFFKYIARSYAKWSSPGAADHLSLIDKTTFPHWLLGESSIQQAFVTRIPGSQEQLWYFCNELYRDVFRYIHNETSPTLLSVEDADSFHKTRQKLSIFWEQTSEDIFREHTLRYRKVKPYAEGHDRPLKLLVIFSVVLAMLNRQDGSGDQNLYRLASRVFKDKEKKISKEHI